MTEITMHQLRRAQILMDAGVESVAQYEEEFKAVIQSNSTAKKRKFAEKYGIEVVPSEHFNYEQRLTLSLVGFTIAMLSETKEEYLSAVAEIFEGDGS